jgi:hypothetical protein
MSNTNPKRSEGTNVVSHTPTPWSVQGHIYVAGPNNGLSVARCMSYTGKTLQETQLHEERAQANATFIVRAVNAHETLIAVCGEALEFLSDPDRCPPSNFDRDLSVALAKALALAKGGAAEKGEK